MYCSCGSGLQGMWEHDAEGIPLVKACDKCIAAKLRKYDPAVLSDEQCELAGLQPSAASYREVVEEQVEPD
jgi:hypothetical protein